MATKKRQQGPSAASSKTLIHLPNTAKESTASFGSVLREYRKKAKLSQQDLATMMHSTRNTVTNWESNKSKPDLDITTELCVVLGIPIAELLGLPQAGVPSQHDQILLQQYHLLSDVGKRTVDSLINTLLKEEQEARDRQLQDNYFLLDCYDTPAAAGTGCPFSDQSAPDYCFVRKNRFNTQADAIIRISGRSMEPFYHDGDSVYIVYTEVANDDDDVVCSTDDGAVIKRFRKGRLYSLNTSMPFGEKYEDDNVRIVGRVLGIVSPDEQPSQDDIPVLEELLADEIHEFYDRTGRP